MTDTITLEDIRKILEEMPPEEKTKVLMALAKGGVDITKSRGDLTGTGVSAFILENTTYEADSHKDVFIKLTQHLIRKYPDKRDCVFGIQGRTKKYFSRSVSDFKNVYENIKGTDIFVDTNENAAQLNRRCQRVLQAFGIDPASFMVIPKYF